MKPGFALSLSFEGIALLHRAADGWRSIGKVPLDAEDLSAELGNLRTRAQDFASGDPACKIIIPNDQIRYLTIASVSPSGLSGPELARQALEGATPYDVADLAFDLSTQGDQTHIAAVARETLAEAETFALEHGFNPVCFVASPAGEPFAGEPYFGAASGQSDPDAIERDSEAVVEIGPATRPAPPPPSDPADKSPREPSVPTSGKDPAPTVSAGFASRRGKPDGKDAAPTLSGASRNPPQPPTDAAPPSEQPDDSRLTLAVSAPTLALPDEEDTETDDATAEDPKQSATPDRFLSRRKSSQGTSAQIEAPSEKPTPRPVAAPASVAPPPKDFAPQDETARMTVFGAREDAQVGGKPRHLGLYLTLGLLAFLVAVAVWAALFLEDGIAGLFRSTPDAVQVATAPEVLSTTPGQVPLSTPTEAQVETGTVLPLTEPPRIDSQTPQSPELPTAESQDSASLSDTNAAVLEALRETQDDSDDPAQKNDALYAATGIWPIAPQAPMAPAIQDVGNLYEVSIDRTDLAQDAVALPAAVALDTDQPMTVVSSPAAPGTAFTLDSDGLVVPTAAGTLNPDGIMVYLGRPSVIPPATPTRFETEPETDALRDRLAGLRPRARPADLVEKNERAKLGGLTLAELGNVRPKARPKTAKQEAEIDETPTAQAVVVSRKPNARPGDFGKTVKQARRDSAGPSEQVATALVAPRNVAPKIPSSASVARQATLDNAINLGQINLIGVYGTPANRRALVRLPSGRYKKVKVGDNVDGGRVLAIGDSNLQYQKGGRNLTLKIPSG